MRAALHFTGHRFIDDEAAAADAIAAALSSLHIVGACGSLASGADILFAEFCARAHVRFCVWLPFGPARFIAGSVTPAGAAWIARFETALSQAATVSILDGGDGDPYAACSSAAMDAAQAWAAAEAAAAVQVALWNGVASTGAAGTGADVAAWRARGLESRIIPILS